MKGLTGVRSALPAVVKTLCPLALCAMLVAACAEAPSLDRAGTQWAPFVEWSLQNPTFDGNPFDLVATATFVHEASGEQRTTGMFYDGDDIWKFRFTGTRTGVWTLRTTSDDPDLGGKAGTVTVQPNPDPRIRGFLTTHGNKFALQVGERGDLHAYRFNVYMNERDFHWSDLAAFGNPDTGDLYLEEAQRHGFDTVFLIVMNNWFELGARKHSEHASENPDPETFRILESVIMQAHSRGFRVHFWAWGDEARQWTPIGVGGINGIPDKRLQRYVAARLGPLPGWTMGYGFDLQEWVSEDQLAEWAEYMHAHLGWQHLLCARGRSNPELGVVSYSGAGPDSYQEVLETINSDPNRPHFFEERFSYLRWDKYDMDTTRRHLWWYTMAGGVGSWWGLFPDSQSYPNAELLRAVAQFWEGRFFLDMEPANALSDGYVLKNATNDRYVVYKEDAAAIEMDLTRMKGAQPAVAVDTAKQYAQTKLGTLEPGTHAWTAPYKSDWAIAVGDFPDRAR